MRPVESITLRLEQKNIGVRGTTVFFGTGADIPNVGTVTTVTETGGPGAMGTHNAGTLKQPTFQVVCRDVDYRKAAAKIDLAYAALGGGADINKIVNLLIGDVFWLWLKPSGEPFTLPLDSASRSRIAFNLEGLRR